MARRFHRFGEPTGENSSEINISPLIDVVFILLIFFIVTTVFVEETGVEVNKPRAASQEELDKNSILIGVTPSGGVFYGGSEIGVVRVRGIVSQLLSEEEKPVIIQADSDTPTETTIRVLDEAKLAGAAVVYVSTVDE